MEIYWNVKNKYEKYVTIGRITKAWKLEQGWQKRKVIKVMGGNVTRVK